MATITKSEFPKETLLEKRTYDYTDSYQADSLDNSKNITVTSILKAFINSTPLFVIYLMFLRDKIVSLFGLKTNRDSYSKNKLVQSIQGKKGEKIGLFKIINLNDREIILGEDDKHLNFRVSFIIETKENHSILILTTTVLLNNLLGRLYFFPVKFFHKLIVPLMLKGIIKELKKDN